MSKRTPFDNVLTQALFDAASEEGDEHKMQRFVEKLTGAHHQQGQGSETHAHTILSGFAKGKRKKYQQVIEGVNQGWLETHKGRDKGGFVNYLDPEAHGHIQGLAAAADHRLSGAIKNRIKEDERRKSFWEKLRNK